MNADSVKARLKNFAIQSGCTFQEALTYYGLERATTDVDFLARRISNSSEEMKSVFQNIFSQDVDDALVFDVDAITVEDITEFKEYHGLHVSFVGYLSSRVKCGLFIFISFFPRLENY